MKFYYTKTLKTLFGDYKNVDTVDEFWNYMEGMAILVVDTKLGRLLPKKVSRFKGNFDLSQNGIF